MSEVPNSPNQQSNRKDPQPIIQAQIVFLASTLNDENLDRNWSEIKSLIEQHGIDNEIYLIKRLLLNFNNQLKVNNVNKSNAQNKLLKLELLKLTNDYSSLIMLKGLLDNEFKQLNVESLINFLDLPIIESLVLSSISLEDLNLDFKNFLIDKSSKSIIMGLGPKWLLNNQSRDLHSFLINLLSFDNLNYNQIQSILLSLNHVLPKNSLQNLLSINVIPNLHLSKSKSLSQFLIEISSTLDLSTSFDLILSSLIKFDWPNVSESNPSSIEIRAAELFSELGQVGLMSSNVDIPTIISILKSYNPQPSFQLIMRAFDSPNNPPPTPNILANILLLAPSNQHDQSSPLLGLLGTWVNPSLQINAIAGLLSLPNDQFSFSNLPCNKIISVDHIQNAGPTIKAMATSVQSSLWNCLDVLELIVNLQKHGVEPINVLARDLLENGCRTHGEIILLGLVQLPKPWSPFHIELTTRLLALFLAGNPSHQLVFIRLWQIDRTFLLGAFKQFYQDNNMNVTRILDVAQDLKILDQVLEVRPITFAFDLAALASRREYLNLEKWLQNGITTHNLSFFRDALKFLDSKAKAEAIRLNVGLTNNQMALNVQTVAMFLRVLRANAEVLPLVAEDIEYYKEVRNLCLQYWPRLMNLTPRTEQEPGLSVTTFSADLDRQVEDYYHRMYSGELRVEEVIVFLEKCKQSNNPRDHELFAAMIHTLFEEYRHYETYPAAELALTGVLFGSLIQYQIIDFIPLGIAIRYVLTALQSLPNTNRFRFGVQALSQFQRRLPEWPQVCQALLAIRHLIETIPDLGFYLKLAIEHSNEVRKTQIDSYQLSSENDINNTSSKLSFNTVKPDNLNDDEPEDYSIPDEETSDKILFIVNNLAPNNFMAKSDEMKERFKAEYSRWFANYLVIERVSIEPNNHQLYMQFLDSINENELLRHVLRETFIKVKELLNDDKTVSSSTERSLLKNLGSWLGGLTLAKNKPIRHRNIAFKELLLEGFDHNKLIVAIPFVCKVLEQCSNSKVFLPPNPWLMAVLKLLVELYVVADLKLNLKFEIEVLCKSLGIELKDIEPTNLVKSRPSINGQLPSVVNNQTNLITNELERLQMTGLPNERIQAAILQQQAQQQQQQQQQQVQAQAQLPLQYQQLVNNSNQQIANNTNTLPESPQVIHEEARAVPANIAPELIASVPNISQYLAFESHNPIFSNNPHLQKMMYLAIDRAIKEIIAPVVERSVTIASLSTRELVVKDFAMEGDETKMQAAAHLMVQNLAGNLTLVTCKEPLRISVVGHFRHVLHQSGLPEQSVPEQSVYTAVNDNLDVACKVIEKIAMNRAIIEVDDHLLDGYISRRKHREHSNQAYWDNAVISSAHFSNSLPDLLRIKPNGLDPQQLQVYEGFNRNNQLQQATVESVVEQQRGSMDNAFGFLSYQQSLDRFNQLLVEIEKALISTPVDSSSQLPPNSELRPLVQEVAITAYQTSNSEDAALQFSQRIVQLLYRSDNHLGREVYVTILQHLCDISIRAAKEVTAWLVFSEDDRKFNVPVTLLLIRTRLIHVEELDVSLSRSIIRDMRQNAIDFAANVIRDCTNENIATRANFTQCLEALTLAAQSGKTSEAMTSLHQTLKSLQPGNFATPVLNRLTNTTNDSETALRQRLALNFADWVRIYGMSPQPEKVFIPFVTQLQVQGVLKGEETSTLFFRICVELGVESFIKQKADGINSTLAFQPIDAFVRLIVLMIKYHADQNGNNHEQAKQIYLNKIISISALVLAQSHEEFGESFEQKPFYRLYSSLLIDLHSIRSHLGSGYIGLLNTISNSIASIQPNIFPRFAYAWTGLISHRFFMPFLLAPENKEGHLDFHRLLTSLLRFISTFTNSANLQISSKALYRGTQRILLLLLHDFPEYLSEYYTTFCDVIPSTCVQLRNLILSAFPRRITNLPDPFSISIDIESMPQSQIIPTISSDYLSILQTNGLIDEINEINEININKLTNEIINKITINENPNHEKGENKYEISLINSIILVVGIKSISIMEPGKIKFDEESLQVKFIHNLLKNLDGEGRYYVISAIANQLRYPSAHTYWFNKLFVYILTSSNDNIIEILTRVLLERLLVTKPHPWGLLLTFSNIFSNVAFKPHQQKFASIAPEFATVFESVEKSFIRVVEN